MDITSGVGVLNNATAGTNTIVGGNRFGTSDGIFNNVTGATLITTINGTHWPAAAA